MNVVIVRGKPAGYDPYGDPAATGEPDRITVPNCIVAPRTTTGTTDMVARGRLQAPGREGIIVGLTLYAPAGTDIRYTDRVEVNGSLYEVEGEPGDWTHPSGWAPGVEVALRRAEG